uniref:Secreted protein n=1 Tax=Trichogramma kaykai TaxID=54128 RepID=A0ABD2W5G9_9HYME
MVRALFESFTESNCLHFSVMFFRFTQFPLGCFGVIYRFCNTSSATCEGSSSTQPRKKRYEKRQGTSHFAGYR